MRAHLAHAPALSSCRLVAVGQRDALPRVATQVTEGGKTLQWRQLGEEEDKGVRLWSWRVVGRGREKRRARLAPQGPQTTSFQSATSA